MLWDVKLGTRKSGCLFCIKQYKFQNDACSKKLITIILIYFQGINMRYYNNHWW